MHDYLRGRIRKREQAMAVANRMYGYQALTQDEERAVAEYEKTGKVPRLRLGGREPWDRSFGLLSKAGYLRYRKIYSGSDTALIS